MQMNNSLEWKKKVIFFIASFIISGGIYLYTVAPTVTFGDSGDFITAAYKLHFAHPPGYPTYIFLAKIFSLLPLGKDIAYRVNLLSVFFAALAVSFSYLLIYQLLKWYCFSSFESFVDRKYLDNIAHSGAMAGALTFAFSNTFWSQALVAKVHPISATLTVVILLLNFLYARTSELRFWFTAVLIWGLSLGIHHTAILYVPCVLYFLISHKLMKKTFSPNPFLISLSLALLGFSIYLLLPLVTPNLGMIEWGKADHWNGFKEILLRTSYGPFELGRSWELVYEQSATAIWVLLTGQSTTITGLIYGILIGLCALFGISWLGQKSRAAAFILGGLAIIVWIFFGAVNNHSMTRQLSLETRDVFFIPAYLIYGLCTGIGIARIGFTLIKRKYYLLAYSIILIIPIIGCIIQFNRHDEHEYYLAKDFGNNILDTMEPNALFIGDDDLHVFPVWYLQQVEHYRKDVIVLSRTALYKKWYYEGIRNMSFPYFQVPIFDTTQVPKDFIPAQTYLDWQMFQFIDQNIKLRPCYYYEKYDLRIKAINPITQVGLLFYVTETTIGNTIGVTPYPYIPPKVDYVYHFTDKDVLQKDFWRTWALDRLSGYHLNQGLYYLSKNEFQKTQQELQKSVRIKPENIAAHYQLGLFYQKRGKKDLAITSFNRVLFFDPDNNEVKRIIEGLKQ